MIFLGYNIKRKQNVSILVLNLEGFLKLILIGFCIYGPVALVSIQALNLVPKNAAGTAAGFVGLSGYLIGDSLLSKIIVGGIADKSWDMANFTMVIGAAVGILLCALTLKSEKN